MKHFLLATTMVLAFAFSAQAEEANIGHMVFFQLTDNSDAAKEKLVAACKKYLKNHEGVLYFSAGARGKQFDREVNAKDWDVALHLVFKNKAAHDKYAVHAEHIKFIDENKANWKSVKVYDSEIEPTTDKK
jgi:hypothetical protein